MARGLGMPRGTLKIALIYRRDFATHCQVKSEICDYLDTFHDRHRILTCLAGRSPANLELKND